MKQPIPIPSQRPYIVQNQPIYPQNITYPPPPLPQHPSSPIVTRTSGSNIRNLPVYAPGMPPQTSVFVQNNPPSRPLPVGAPIPGSIVRGPQPEMPGSRVLGSPFGGYPVYYFPVQ